MAKKLFNKTKKNFNKSFKSAVEAEKYNEEVLTVARVKEEAMRINKVKEEVLKKAKILNELASQDSTWEVKAYMDDKVENIAPYIHADKPDNSIQLNLVGMNKPGVALSEVKLVMPTEVAQIIFEGYAVGDENIFNKMQQLGISFIGINPVDNPEPIEAKQPIENNPFTEEDKKNWKQGSGYWWPADESKANTHDEIKQKALDALKKVESKEFINNDLDKEITKSFEAVNNLINFMPMGVMPKGVVDSIYGKSTQPKEKSVEDLWGFEEWSEWKDIEKEAKRIIDKIGFNKPEWRKEQLDKLNSIQANQADLNFFNELNDLDKNIAVDWPLPVSTGFKSIDKAIKEANGDNFLIGSAPKATQKQLNYLKKLGWDGDIPTTQSEASKLITKLVGKDNGPGPTLKQINYLAKLGYTGDEPETKKEASALIDKIKSSIGIKANDFDLENNPFYTQFRAAD